MGCSLRQYMVFALLALTADTLVDPIVSVVDDWDGGKRESGLGVLSCRFES